MSAPGLALLVVALGALWFVLALATEAAYDHFRPVRVQPAGQPLDFDAALHCGPLPPFGHEDRP